MDCFNFKKTKDLSNIVRFRFSNTHVYIYEPIKCNLVKQIEAYNDLKNKPIFEVISLISGTDNIDILNKRKTIDIVNINLTYLMRFFVNFFNDTFFNTIWRSMLCLFKILPNNIFNKI